jgi:hypothetical protein
MSSVESLSASQPEENDPSLPRIDLRLSREDQGRFQAALADAFNNQRAVEMMLRSTDYPMGRIPSFENSNAHDVWGEILFEIRRGIIQAGVYQLLREALRRYSANPDFVALADTYRHGPRTDRPGGAQEPAGSADSPETDGPQRVPSVPPQAPSESPACHVIIRASTEESREQATRALRELGLDPHELWSTAHAVSYRVGSDQLDHVRALLDRTDFGWTVVAPGEPDYLLHALYVEGPDGRNFRITDAPAQQTVGNLAAEVVDQYGPELPDAARPAVVDHVGPDGQGRRLDPDRTLDESGIRDGDQVRVGFQARAAAVNPLDRQDALYRVRNQIRAFGDTRDSAQDFVVSANSSLMPTEYVLEFRQQSFGPPPSPESSPGDIDQHRVLIQLGSDFPESPPMVFWLSQIFHPNVFPTYECEASRGREAQKGLVCLGALKESYVPSLHFGSLCQLLMDIAAFRNYSLYKVGGTVDSTGALRRQADFFDRDAAIWAQSEDGQRRILAIKGAPVGDARRSRPVYRNVIEKIGDE